MRSGHLENSFFLILQHPLRNRGNINHTPWSERLLWSFDFGDGIQPTAGVISERGNFYGTTKEGGANCPSLPGCGTVFELSLP
jgi:uncharacterized repeat protein (TIGR03803 family)